jgi:NusA-like KH domain protein
MKITISNAQFQYMQLFERVIKVPVLDCVIPNENSVVFVVPEKHGKLAVGKQGSNVKKLAEKLNNKSIYIIEYNENLKEFIKNIWHPYDIKVFLKENNNKLCIYIDTKLKKSKQFYLNLTKTLVERLFKTEVDVYAKWPVRRKSVTKKEKKTKIEKKEN